MKQKESIIKQKENLIEQKEELISEKEDNIKEETDVKAKVSDYKESRVEDFQPAILRGRRESRKLEEIIKEKEYIIKEKENLLAQKEELILEEEDDIKQETDVKPHHQEDPWQRDVHKDIPEDLPDGSEVTCGRGKGPSWSRMGQMIIQTSHKCR